MYIRNSTSNQIFLGLTSTSLGVRSFRMLGRGGKCGKAAFSSPPNKNLKSGGRAKSRPF